MSECVDYDSDETIGLDSTPQTSTPAKVNVGKSGGPIAEDFDATVGQHLNITPGRPSKSPDREESDGSTSLESVFEVDPDYDGPPAQSQPCHKRGITYLPEGWRVSYVKKRKLNFDDCQ